ncbi:P68 family surface lipoprotein [Mycoplasmopsis columboralis]|uniref:Lipoprotein n=1 Tax=Mycoplasmopsis columboralis TaxID=171282 RepID=A0A449B7E4_9BACT|nr:P80 family lipoprotein [Mycoplasmopsis columboralis]VEU76508.1 lipoprotein [Mycoplasmopsis columboralis]
MTSKFKKIILGTATILGATGIAASCGSSNNADTPIKEGGNTSGGSSNSNQTISEAEQLRIDNASNGANPSADGRFNTNVQDTIKLGTTFSSGGAQAQTLDKILEVYNKLVSDKSADLSEGAKAVEQKNLGSGYDKGSEKVTSDLNARNTDNFYNLIMNYGDVAAKLAEKNMLLSFNDELDGYNVDIDDFSSVFAKANTSIENVRNESTYLIPLAKSTNFLAVNAPVLSYLIDSMVSAGAKLADDQETKEFVDTIKAKGEADRSGVVSIWGNPRSGVSMSDVTISKQTFEIYKDTLDFAAKAQSLFENSYNNNDPVNAQVHVFGVDGSPSLLFQSLYSEIDAEDLKMISYATKSEGITQVNFGSLKNTASTAYTKSSEIYSEIAKAVQSGGLKLFPGGQFSSGDQTHHRIAFSTGSTAGYTHNYIADTKIYSKGSSIKFNGDLIQDRSTMVSINTRKNGTDEVARLSRFGNPLYKSTHKIDKDDKYGLIFLDAENEKAFTDQLAASTTVNGKDLLIKVLYNEDVQEHKDFLKLVKEKGVFGGLVRQANVDATTGSRYMLIYVKEGRDSLTINQKTKDLLTNDLQLVESGKDRTKELNREELVSMYTPLKWRKENKVKVIYGQGPSLIGIHANDTDDKATKAFVKWLFTNKTYTFASPVGSDDSTYTLTPIQFFNKFASYVTPYKGFETQDSSELYGDNEYLKTAADLFKTATLNPKEYVVFEEPSSIHSSLFRKSIEAGFDSLQTAAVSKKTQSFTEFISKISFPKN